MVDVSMLTPEQKSELFKEMQQDALQKAKCKEREIETYKSLVNQAVSENFPVLQELSGELATKKQKVRESFDTIIKLKYELYDNKQEGQFSHSFMSADGKKRIRIGYNTVDNYDDTVEVGIAKVNTYIQSLVKDADTAKLVSWVQTLLAKDKSGKLKPSRVLQLQQMAEKRGNAAFIEGVKIIRDAYKPTESKSFVRAEYKNEHTGAWVSVPLGMTEAE